LPGDAARAAKRPGMSHTLTGMVHVLATFVIFNYSLYLLKYQITPPQLDYIKKKKKNRLKNMKSDRIVNNSLIFCFCALEK
jgi:hypothetical protein